MLADMVLQPKLRAPLPKGNAPHFKKKDRKGGQQARQTRGRHAPHLDLKAKLRSPSLAKVQKKTRSRPAPHLDLQPAAHHL